MPDATQESRLNKFAEIRDGDGTPVVQMFGPPNALSDPNPVSSGLYLLSETLIRGLLPDQGGGGLGGEFGYGADYENDVFMMHPYCWCEKRDCLWCTIWLGNEGATEKEAAEHREKQEAEISFRFGEPPAKYDAAPHFWHKPSGLKVCWYKWIGRDMDVNPPSISEAGWADILRECWDSIPQDARERAEKEHAHEQTPEYKEQREAAHAAMAKAVQAMFEAEQPCWPCSEALSEVPMPPRDWGGRTDRGAGGMVAYTLRDDDSKCVNCKRVTTPGKLKILAARKHRSIESLAKAWAQHDKR